MSVNASCPLSGSSLPDPHSLSLPSNISVAFIAGSNAADPAMAACCAPFAVSVLDGCYEWCELPDQYTNTSTARQGAALNFGACLRANGDNSTIVGSNVVAAGDRLGLSLRGMGVVALLAAGALLF